MGAILLSAISRNPYPAVVAVPLVTYIILAMLFSHRPHVEVSVGRSSEGDGLYEDEARVCSVRVRNEGGRLDVVEVVDVLPAGMRLKSGSNRTYASLGPGDELTLRYGVESPSFGSFSLGPVRVRSLDTFGIFAEERTVERRERLTVFPKLHYVEHLELGLRLTRNWPGEIVSRRTGPGSEFYSIRPHIAGDLPKNINWRASARSEELQTNQYMSELGGEVMIVLDARKSTEVGRPLATALSYSTRAAATIAYSLLRDRNRVGLLVVGDRLVKVQPGFGRRQFDLMLYALVGVEAGSMWEMRNLPQYLKLLYPKADQLVVVSPQVDDDVFFPLLELASMGRSLTLLSPSPLELERETLERGRVEAVAEGLARLEREARLSLLRRRMYVIEWDVQQPLAASLSEGMMAWRKVGAR
jgi:uncharacterized protein (DUF58 family)